MADLEAAVSPSLLLALDLQPVQHLSSRFRSYGDWSPLARLAFALRAGYGARLVLAGQRALCFTWCAVSPAFAGKAGVKAVNPAFAGKAGVEAFLIGAGRRWPPQYRSQ